MSGDARRAFENCLPRGFCPQGYTIPPNISRFSVINISSSNDTANQRHRKMSGRSSSCVLAVLHLFKHHIITRSLHPIHSKPAIVNREKSLTNIY